ncbi:MAG: transposase [Reyranella sp.]
MSDTELTSISEPAEPVRRFEVFTGSGRRRSWSAEQKEWIVAETLSGEESVSAVARRHGLTPQQLFSWRRQAGIERMAVSQELGFASVVVAPGVIEIELDGMTIRVLSGSDASTVRAVLQAAKAVS